MDRHEKARKHLKKLGFGTKSFSNLVLVAEALERGVEVGVSRSGRRIALRKESRNRYWKAGASNLNSKLAIRMTHRKDVCSRFLRAYLPNIPENCVFTGAEIERAWSWAEPMESLVLKPYNGALGAMCTSVSNLEMNSTLRLGPLPPGMVRFSSKNSTRALSTAV